MALITLPFTFSAGAVIVASQHNSNFTTISSDYNGNIDNSNIVSNAGIVYSKLNLATSILNADINASASIANSKLNLVSITGTVNIGTALQGRVFYDNGTSIVGLASGTSGYALLTQGTSNPPAWGPLGAVTLVSNTPISTASNSGDIAITSTNYYKVLFQFNSLSAASTVLIRFNNDTGNNYLYAFSGRTESGAISGGSGGASGSSISLGTAVSNNSTITTDGDFNIFPTRSNTIKCNGHLTYQDNAGGLITLSDWTGYWNNANPTSFRILTSGTSTFSGSVLLYKFSTV